MTGARFADQWLEDDVAHYQALFDPLTTFPTRALLQDRLDVALAQSVRTRHYVAVFYIPLDRMEGTAREIALVVRSAAAALRSAVRPGDTIARIRDDAFVVVCPEIVYEEDTAPILERLVSSVNRPSIVVAEVGVALGRGVADPDELLGASIDAAAPFTMGHTIAFPRRADDDEPEDLPPTDEPSD
jgi:GGDEF domain-containing protein